METETTTYYLAMPNGNVYFTMADGVVYSQGQRTDVPFDRFVDFLHTAELLGFRIGKV